MKQKLKNLSIIVIDANGDEWLVTLSELGTLLARRVSEAVLKRIQHKV